VTTLIVYPPVTDPRDQVLYLSAQAGGWRVVAPSTGAGVAAAVAAARSMAIIHIRLGTPGLGGRDDMLALARCVKHLEARRHYLVVSWPTGYGRNWYRDFEADEAALLDRADVVVTGDPTGVWDEDPLGGSPATLQFLADSSYLGVLPAVPPVDGARRALGIRQQPTNPLLVTGGSSSPHLLAPVLGRFLDELSAYRGAIPVLLPDTTRSAVAAAFPGVVGAVAFVARDSVSTPVPSEVWLQAANCVLVLPSPHEYDQALLACSLGKTCLLAVDGVAYRLLGREPWVGGYSISEPGLTDDVRELIDGESPQRRRAAWHYARQWAPYDRARQFRRLISAPLGQTTDTSKAVVLKTVSVIVATMDAAAWIGECLTSICCSEHGDVEVIVVDGGSRDDTRSIVRHYAAHDGRVRLVCADGATSGEARNLGVLKSSGEFLAFVDAQDLIPEGAYRVMLRAAVGAEADIVTGQYLEFSGSGTRIPTLKWPVFEPSRTIDGVEQTPDLIRYRICGNKLLRRSFWSRAGLQFSAGPSDSSLVAMTAAIVRSSRITLLDDLVCLRRHETLAAESFGSPGRVDTYRQYLEQECRSAKVVRKGCGEEVLRSYASHFLRYDGRARTIRFLATATGATDEVANVQQPLRDLLSVIKPARLGPGHAPFQYVMAAVAEGYFAQAVLVSDHIRGHVTGDTAAAYLTPLAAVMRSHTVRWMQIRRLILRPDILGLMEADLRADVPGTLEAWPWVKRLIDLELSPEPKSEAAVLEYWRESYHQRIESDVLQV
jgi:glycosyltransferase involved in cell wall biosynthesis